MIKASIKNGKCIIEVNGTSTEIITEASLIFVHVIEMLVSDGVKRDDAKNVMLESCADAYAVFCKGGKLWKHSLNTIWINQQKKLK